jgi:hypothetical protein
MTYASASTRFNRAAAAANAYYYYYPLEVGTS